jgi:antitoxin PrlF
MTAIGKITSKGQTTVPREIREALGVRAGDLLAWEVFGDGGARVRVVKPLDLKYLRALEETLSEWGGAADEDAYRDL